MTTPAPYVDEQQIENLKNDATALGELRKQYMAYFRENQCELINAAGWVGLGEYFLRLAMDGAHGLEQTREQFEQATAGYLKQPVPAWIKKVVYVQTQEDGTYYLALPPEKLAKQAYLHSLNPVTSSKDYVMPPIYSGFQTEDPKEILNTRICDYVISHCG